MTNIALSLYHLGQKCFSASKRVINLYAKKRANELPPTASSVLELKQKNSQNGVIECLGNIRNKSRFFVFWNPNSSALILWAHNLADIFYVKKKLLKSPKLTRILEIHRKMINTFLFFPELEDSPKLVLFPCSKIRRDYLPDRLKRHGLYFLEFLLFYLQLFSFMAIV